MLFFHKHTSSIILTAIISGFLPVSAVAQNATEPYEQDFVLTAYYSPLPDQCCYVRGTYEADKLLNGEGTHGADGTAVYPGMIAAPASYAFGTRVDLGELGVFTVHDRGGAIIEQEDTHRLDVWVGSGEEGLARALAFGVQEIRGTVYPVAADAPEESFDIASMPATAAELQPYVVADATASQTPRWGTHGETVRVLQQQLQVLGYFAHEVTDYFGDVTRASLASFIADMQLTDPSDTLTGTVTQYLQVALFFKAAPTPIAFINETSSPSDIRKAQRYLRSLGYYRGRTNGVYAQNLFNAILAYQQEKGLVAGAASPGAGLIGPLTKGALDRDILQRRITKYMQHRKGTDVASTGELGAL